MEQNLKFTKFIVEQPDLKIIWEMPTIDISGEDCMNAFVTMLSGLTFFPSTIYKICKDYVENSKFMFETKDNE